MYVDTLADVFAAEEVEGELLCLPLGKRDLAVRDRLLPCRPLAHRDDSVDCEQEVDIAFLFQ